MTLSIALLIAPTFAALMRESTPETREPSFRFLN